MKLIKLFSPRGKKFYFSIAILTGIRPKNINLYELALTHKSFMAKDAEGSTVNNERLEYLGDAVLGTIVAHELYIRYPEGSEGFLTKIRSRMVNRNLLNDIAYSMGLTGLIHSNLQTDPTHTHVPGDALEALIGAVFIDHGYETCRKFVINELIGKHINIDKLAKKDTNYKSLLIEWAQKHKKSIDFITDEHHSTDTANPVFIARAVINGETAGEGEGPSKKEAQQNAARNALKKVSRKPPTL